MRDPAQAVDSWDTSHQAVAPPAISPWRTWGRGPSAVEAAPGPLAGDRWDRRGGAGPQKGHGWRVAGFWGPAAPAVCIRLQVQWFEQQTLRRRVKRSVVVPTDPWFPKQWYMVRRLGWGAGWGGARAPLTPVYPPHTEQQGAAGPEHPAGLEPGAVGAGRCGLCPGRRHREGPPGPLGQLREAVGSGVQGWRLPQVPQPPSLMSPLRPQDPLASYDFNDYDPDPQPRYTPSDENR